MKYWLVFLIVLPGIVLGLGAVWWPATGSFSALRSTPTDLGRQRPSRLEVTPLEVDLGDLTPGDSRTSNFQFRNSTSSAITIVEIKTSCGCTIPSLTCPSTIEPNTALSVSIQTHIATSAARGISAQQVTFITDVLHEEKVPIVIKSNIVPRPKPYTVPNYVNLGQVASWEKRIVEFTLHFSNEEPVHVKAVTVSKPGLELEMLRSSDDNGLMYQLIAPSDMPVGDLACRIVFDTDLGSCALDIAGKKTPGSYLCESSVPIIVRRSSVPIMKKILLRHEIARRIQSAQAESTLVNIGPIEVQSIDDEHTELSMVIDRCLLDETSRGVIKLTFDRGDAQLLLDLCVL